MACVMKVLLILEHRIYEEVQMKFIVHIWHGHVSLSIMLFHNLTHLVKSLIVPSCLFQPGLVAPSLPLTLGLPLLTSPS